VRLLTVHEHTRIRRCETGEPPEGSSLEAHLYDRLQATDLGRKDVFEWGHRGCKTKQWVGVVQAPGIQVEILPKTDAFFDHTEGEEQKQNVRSNLLFMLALSGEIPVRKRDLARLCTRRAPLQETLMALFAERLRDELLRGPERAYEEREENFRQFKGKLVVNRQVMANAARSERFYCRHDEFTADTRLNRIFKTCCHLLLGVSTTPTTQEGLRQSLLLLQDVSDTPVQVEDLGKINLTRQNERFGDLLAFCRLVMEGRSPLGQAGATTTFSLLFDMNRVFENFIAAFLQRHVVPRMAGVEVYPQGARHQLPLMTHRGKDILRLKPDLLLEAPGQRLVVDTKWKQLAPAGGRGVGREDLYQLFAYLHRYGCKRSVLLYPHLPELESREFDVLDEADRCSKQVWVRTVKLHANLHQEAGRKKLADELEQILMAGLEQPASAA